MEFSRKTHSALLIACGLLSVGTSAANAADITFLGSDTTTGAAWRSTSVVKTPAFDPGGDNAYGNDGYYLPGNASGFGGPTTIASSLPAFISSCQLHGAVPNYSSNTYVSYNDPTLSIGPTVADQQGAIWYFLTTDTTDPKYGMVGFTLATDAHFVLTVILSQGRPSGTGGNSALAVQHVANFWNTATLASAEVTNAQMPAFASHADYLFFEINGHAGDNIAISMNGAQNSGFAGIAFEKFPALGPYATWAATHVEGEPANNDTDQDGLQNGVEYFMNAAAGFTANPGIVETAGPVRTITWSNGGNIAFTDYGTQFVVRTSPDLVNWTAVPAEDANLSNTSGSVTYSLPINAGPFFVRLVVSPN